MAGKRHFDPAKYRAFEQDGYSRVADQYEIWADRVTAQANHALLHAVGTGPGTRLLDVACGPGTLSQAASDAGCAVIGLDFAASMLPIARARCPAGSFHVGDAEWLPFRNGSFDSVLCCFGIMHFARPELAIAEVYRVLKPGGRYAFTGWPPPERNPFMGLVLGAVEAHGNPNVDLPQGPPLFRFGDSSECASALRAAGFTDIEIDEIPIMARFARAEEVVPRIRTTTARLGPLLNLQTEEERLNIERAITAGALDYATSDGVQIPMPALLAVGRKP